MKRNALIFTLAFSLSGCMTAPAWPEQQRPKNWGSVVAAESNLYQISVSVYRSEQPDADLIPALKAHDIQMVINLRTRDKDRLLLSADEFQLVHIPVKTWAMSRGDLLQVMQSIQQAQANDQKVLIHCYHGSDRTGASIAMYRIIFERWTVQEALNEMKHGGYGFHPVWINIERLFSPENIGWIRQQLANPS
ncbi:dual specificity protein phosphatase family protein [Acinetobacter sp.]|uniref:dual specificity protein phosphatase family protein n=1 Tax=Acinetobacter sp. TaxID=472 RepID=UPI002FCC535E